jgi:hypothetical protein
MPTLLTVADTRPNPSITVVCTDAPRVTRWKVPPALS